LVFGEGGVVKIRVGKILDLENVAPFAEKSGLDLHWFLGVVTETFHWLWVSRSEFTLVVIFPIGNLLRLRGVGHFIGGSCLYLFKDRCGVVSFLFGV